MKKLASFIFFLALLVGFGNQGWVKLYKLRQVGKVLEAKNHAIAENNLKLHQEIENLQNAKYLDHYIRKELGFVKDNEMIYEFPQEK